MERYRIFSDEGASFVGRYYEWSLSAVGIRLWRSFVAKIRTSL